MECKAGYDYNQVQNCVNDLIETLWNVKLKDIPDGKEFTYDLIETLWNVKFIFSVFVSLSVLI